MKFGKLLVIEKTENPNNKKKQTYWFCKCDCGNSNIATTADLNGDKITQCTKCSHIQTGLSRRKDLTGNTYGHLTVKEMIYDDTGRTRCICDCDCGNKNVIKDTDKLHNKSIHSCGCARKEIARIHLGRQIDGKRFGRLLVVETYWDEYPTKVKCKCDCGDIGIYNKKDVQTGHTKSCGCLQSDMASIASTKDWSNTTSEYGVALLSQDVKNESNQWLWRCKCGLCGKEFSAIPAKILNGHITSCGCRKASSKEDLIESFLISNNIKYISQYSFDDCRFKQVLKFDFAIFNKKEELTCLIEYDGRQHYEPIDLFGGIDNFLITQKRDEIKNKYCLDNNLNLLRLPYYLTDEEIKQKIINIIYP